MDPRPHRVLDVEIRVVEPPFVDGAKVDAQHLGLFSGLAEVRACLAKLRRRRHWLVRHEPGALVHLHAVEHRLDRANGRVRTWTLDADGRVRGVTSLRKRGHWPGKPPAECRFQPGDIVAMVDRDTYSLGVVLEQPVPPELAARVKPDWFEQDAYLVGLVDPHSTHAHEHPHEWELWSPPEPPDAETLRRLRHRLALAEERIPPPRCEVCGGHLAWCDPGDGLHALMTKYGLRPRGWCQVPEGMLAEAESVALQLLEVQSWPERRVRIADWCGRLCVEPWAKDGGVLERLREVAPAWRLPG